MNWKIVKKIRLLGHLNKTSTNKFAGRAADSWRKLFLKSKNVSFSQIAYFCTNIRIYSFLGWSTQIHVSLSGSNVRILVQGENFLFF